MTPPASPPTAAPRTIALLLLGVILCLDVLSVRRDSLTNDEPVHHRYGMNVLRGDPTRFDDSKMPVTALNALPALVASRLAPGRLRDLLQRVEAGRYVTIAFSLLVAWHVFKWSRELYGPAAGLFSLFLYAFDPNVIAHSRLITTDAYVTGMILLASYCFWRFLNRGGARAALISAASLGLAQLAKYTSAFLYPIFGLIVLAREGPGLATMIKDRDQHGVARALGSFLKQALLFAGVSLLIVNAGFLFSRSFTRLGDYSFRSELFRTAQGLLPAGLPVPLPYPYLEGLDWVWLGDRTGVGYTYLLGELRGGEGFKGYFFYASLFKVPLPALALMLAALVACASRRSPRRFLDNELFLLAPVIFFAVYFNFFSRAHWGIRIFLVVFPLLHVLCGVLVSAWQARGPTFKAGLAFLLAWLAASVLSYHPHYIPYFNELVWDRKQAYRYLSDSNLDWGQGAWFLARYQEQHPEARVEPREPRAGRIVVGASKLTGVFNPKRYRWLRENFEPVEAVAYAYLVFEVTPERLQQLGAAGEPAER